MQPDSPFWQMWLTGIPKKRWKRCSAGLSPPRTTRIFLFAFLPTAFSADLSKWRNPSSRIGLEEAVKRLELAARQVK